MAYFENRYLNLEDRKIEKKKMKVINSKHYDTNIMLLHI